MDISLHQVIKIKNRVNAEWRCNIMSKSNPFEIAQKQLDDCAKILNLDPGVHEFLRHPRREFHISIPVRMDDGSMKIFQGYRVQYTMLWVPARAA
jgi:glutamate dehydrogenase (NAD(P)+)